MIEFLKIFMSSLLNIFTQPDVIRVIVAHGIVLVAGIFIIKAAEVDKIP